MKTVTLHHWVTHGLIGFSVFLVLGWVQARPNNRDGVKIPTNTLAISIGGSLVISGMLIAGFIR